MHRSTQCKLPGVGHRPFQRHTSRVASRPVVVAQAMKALIFDCDGVILESEGLHRQCYNAAFSHFNIKCGDTAVDWTEKFHAAMEKNVGFGFKRKLRWYFDKNGWPTSSVPGLTGQVPQTQGDQDMLIEALQVWKNGKYEELIGSGEVEPRPGVLRLMDEAQAAGMKLAVCSAATKSTVAFTLKSLLGKGRFEGLDCFIAGDDVPAKKPDPSIYKLAAERMGLKPEECVVVEDTTVGLQAARDAGMRCIITYTPSSKYDTFPGAERIIQDLGSYPAMVTVKELQERRIVQDDRIEMTMTDSAVYFHIPEQ